MAKTVFYETEAFNNIFITEHAHKRWKQRVGKGNKVSIAKYIRRCASSNRIEHYWEKFYILDNDIVIRAEAKYDKEGNFLHLVLVTAFGRISENPALNNIPVLVKEKKKYGKMLKKRKDLIS